MRNMWYMKRTNAENYIVVQLRFKYLTRVVLYIPVV